MSKGKLSRGGLVAMNKLNTSRNKREGYYAGKCRPNQPWERRKPYKYMRWTWFDMNEHYPPIWGSVWKMDFTQPNWSDL
jgi:hypothetical protein